MSRDLNRDLFLSLNAQLPQNGSAVSPTGSYWRDPTIYPPPERDDIDDFAYIALPAIGASAAILTRQLDAGHTGILRAYGNNFVGGGWTEGSGAVTWAILIDSAPAPGYDNILGSLGSPSNPTYHPAGIRISEASTIIFQVTNNSVVLAGQVIGARWLGYQYPKEYDDPSLAGTP